MAFKPNRDLLNVNFEGYKLSPSPIKCVSSDIAGAGVHIATLKDGDFSYQHVRAYSLHNHLTADPYDQSTVYWTSADGSLQRGTYQVRLEPYCIVPPAPDTPSQYIYSLVALVNGETLNCYNFGSSGPISIFQQRFESSNETLQKYV